MCHLRADLLQIAIRLLQSGELGHQSVQNVVFHFETRNQTSVADDFDIWIFLHAVGGFD